MILHAIALTLLNDDHLPHTPAGQSQINHIMTIIFTIVGALAFLVMVISGFLYVMSAGDPTKVARAKSSIIYSAVGVIVAALAASIVRYVIGKT